MRRGCYGGGHGPSGGRGPAGCLGIGLIVLGLLLLVLSLPSWLWMSLLGVILAAIGFLILRFN